MPPSATGGPAAVEAASAATPDALISALALEHARGHPVIVVSGGAEVPDDTYAAIDALLGPAVAAAAQRSAATVIDGATDAGVMRIVGRARARRPDALPVLVGVAPGRLVHLPGAAAVTEPTVAVEPNHTHVVLTAGDDWGDETPVLFDLAEALAQDAPVVTVLVNGGAQTAAEAAQAARRGWPVVVLERTGGVAGELARLWRRHRVWRTRPLAFLLPYRLRYRRRPPTAQISDPALRAVVERGDVRIEPGTDAGRLGARLAWETSGRVVVQAAWQRFATYDALATRLRRTFEHWLAAVLVLGALATLLALIHDATGGRWLHWIVVALPIVVSVLIALSNRRAAGPRWVLLRAAAESIKSELHRYRTRTAPYARDRDRELAERVGAIAQALLRTEASAGPLSPYDGPMPPAMYGSAADDDGLSDLDADGYLRVRVGSQLEYYHGRVRGLDRRRGQLNVMAVAAGGAGALLAAAGIEVWIGLTTTIAAAATSYLGYLQFDSTIVSYNQAASRLEALRDGWTARPEDDRTRRRFGELVDRAEAVLTSELGGWVQQMDSSLKEQREEHLRRARDVDPAAGGDGPATDGPPET